MNNLIIRKYNNDDFIEVLTLLKSHFNIKEHIKSLIDNDISYGIVAVTNQKIVGYIRVDKLKDIGRDCLYYILNYVCVDSNYQNMNIATTMLNYIFDNAKKDKVKYIELTSKPIREIANHLYLKNGFIIRDTNVFRKEI